jgi:hypothetical protein
MGDAHASLTPDPQGQAMSWGPHSPRAVKLRASLITSIGAALGVDSDGSQSRRRRPALFDSGRQGDARASALGYWCHGTQQLATCVVFNGEAHRSTVLAFRGQLGSGPSCPGP